MTGSDVLQNANSAVTKLSEEIRQHRDRWQKVKSEWIISNSTPRNPISPRSYQKSYLENAMASELAGANSHRACLFQASVRAMHMSDEVRNRKQTEAALATGGNSLLHAVAYDKFSTELAGVPTSASDARSMIDFSRFLLELSGERQLANARDPVRELDFTGNQGDRPSMQHDRLIR